jgi:hypothetical protein
VFLNRDDIDLERGRIRIRRLKGGLSGERPIFRNLLPLLCQYLESRKDNNEALFVGLQGRLKKRRIQSSSVSTLPTPISQPIDVTFMPGCLPTDGVPQGDACGLAAGKRERANLTSLSTTRALRESAQRHYPPVIKGYPRQPHLVTGGEDSATFLVLQGIGEYDFVPLVLENGSGRDGKIPTSDIVVLRHSAACAA